MIAATPPPDGGWKPAPLLAAVGAHREAGHPGETVGCGECAAVVDEALAAAFEKLARPPGWRPGGLFPA